MPTVSPCYSRGAPIERQAFRNDGNGPLACSGLQTELVERTPEKDASTEPSTKQALKLFISMSSLLQACPSIDRLL